MDWIEIRDVSITVIGVFVLLPMIFFMKKERMNARAELRQRLGSKRYNYEMAFGLLLMVLVTLVAVKFEQGWPVAVVAFVVLAIPLEHFVLKRFRS